MRPPTFAGGNRWNRRQWPVRQFRFNEAADFCRRKPIRYLSRIKRRSISFNEAADFCRRKPLYKAFKVAETDMLQ